MDIILGILLVLFIVWMTKSILWTLVALVAVAIAVSIVRNARTKQL